jgi:hypothetical protein
MPNPQSQEYLNLDLPDQISTIEEKKYTLAEFRARESELATKKFNPNEAYNYVQLEDAQFRTFSIYKDIDLTDLLLTVEFDPKTKLFLDQKPNESKKFSQKSYLDILTKYDYSTCFTDLDHTNQ